MKPRRAPTLGKDGKLYPGRRRLNGEAHIGKPRPDGLIPGYVTLGGKRRWFYARSQAEWKRKRSAILAQHAESTLGRTAITLATWISDWIIRRSQLGKLRESTVVRYSQLLRLHIAPTLGSVDLTELTPEQLDALYVKLLTAGLAPQTVVHVHRLLHASLAFAEKRRASLGLGASWRNPAALAEPPDVPKADKRPVDLDEVFAVLAAVEGDRLEALYWLAFWGGLRQGELFDLERPDVNPQASTVQIRQRARRIPGQGIKSDEPKSDASKRVVTVPRFVMALLQARLDAVEAEWPTYRPRWRKTERVFTNSAGGYLEPQNFLRRVWYPLLVRAGIPEALTMHEFTRHGHASLATHLRADPETLRRRMGHSRIETTNRHYVHPVKGADAAIAELMDKLIRRRLSPKSGAKRSKKVVKTAI